MKFNEALSIVMTLFVLAFVGVVILPAVISMSDVEEKTLYIQWKEVDYISGEQEIKPHNVYWAYDDSGNKYLVDGEVYPLLVVGRDNRVAITNYKRSLISDPEPTITAVDKTDYWGK